MSKTNNIINEGKKGISNDILQSPSLKENPFTVPNGYFAKVENDLHVRIYNQENESGSVLSFFRTTIAMVAMFALVFVLGYSVFYITGTSDYKNMEIAGETAIMGNNNTSDAISDEELIQYLGSYPAYNQQDTSEKIDVIEPTLNKDEIEQYLIDTNASSLVVLAALEKNNN